jgi:hypothetical protein
MTIHTSTNFISRGEVEEFNNRINQLCAVWSIHCSYLWDEILIHSSISIEVRSGKGMNWIEDND